MSDKKNIVEEPSQPYYSAKDAETERLRKNVFRSDMEKLSLFTQMLRTNKLYKKATVTHK